MEPETLVQVFLDRCGRLTWRGRIPTAKFDVQVAEGGRVAVTIGGVTEYFDQGDGTLRGRPMAFANDVALVYRGQHEIMSRSVPMYLEGDRYHLASFEPKVRVVGWYAPLMAHALASLQ